MMNLRTLLGLLAVLALSACATAPVSHWTPPAPHKMGAEVGTYPNDPNPTQFFRLAGDDGCPDTNPCSTGTTYGITLQQVWSAANFMSGINTQMHFTCADGCGLTSSGAGYIDANRLGGVNLPINAALTATGANGQLVPVVPTPGGCIGVQSGQIFQNCVQSPGFAAASLPTCNAAALGLHEIQNDLTAFPPTRGNAAAGGGTSGAWEVECVKNASGTYLWAYL